MAGTRSSSTPGDLQVLARIGVGGMGEVLLARRIGAGGFEKLVALKTIRADLAEHEGMRRMFLDEAKLLARLDHPSIAQVYELRERDGALQLLMEYVPGLALGTLLKRKKAPVPPGVAALMAAEAARGLHAAHELTDLDGRALGVIHRDISPQNLILTFDGRIKVLDFGVAFVRDREATTTEAGVVKGKLAYLSPEQIQGKKIDRRADLYALSVVLHELLTARRLFGRGESLADAVKRGRIAKPSSTNKEVPPELDALVLKGLARDPDARFTDAKEMALALEACARQLGAESLESYAARELAAERELHRSFLQRVMTAPEATTERGKASGTESLSPLDLVEVVSDFSQTPRPPPNTGPWLILSLLLVVLGASAVAALRPEWINVAEERFLASWAPAVDAGLDEDGGLEAPAIDAALAITSTRAVDPPGPITDAPMTATVALTAVLTVETSSSADTVASAEEEDEEPEVPLPAATSTPTPAPRTAAPAPVPPSRSAPKPSAKAPPPKPRAPAKRPPKPGFGALSIVARPGGTIYVDGRRAGATPLERYRLKVGRHAVTLKRPGDPRPRWRSTVNINEGKLVRITLR